MNDKPKKPDFRADVGGPRRLFPACQQMRGTQHGRIKMHYNERGIICPGSDALVSRPAGEGVAQ